MCGRLARSGRKQLLTQYSDPCAPATATPTVTTTVTGTPPSATPTRTLTNTPTITNTPTVTRTPSSTPTLSPSITPTSTLTRGTSNTPTPVPPTTTCCYPGGNVSATCTTTDTYNFDLVLYSDTPNCSIPLRGPVYIYFQVSSLPDPGGTWTDLDHYSAGTVTIMPHQTIHVTGSFHEPSIPMGDSWYRLRWTMSYVNCLGGRVAEGYNDAVSLCAATGGTAASTPTRTWTGTAGVTATAITGSAVPSVSPSRTVTTETPTVIVASPTAIGTAIPTACTLTFADIPSGSTFYPYVRCLACRGILTGYACGGEGEPCDPDSTPYFRPSANVTRGQIAKIVSNSAGFQEDPGPQVYEDVSSTNTFYSWINRLSNRGYMGGYPCGALSEEPCVAPNNMPYFRVFNNATRGQISKIVSNAAGYTGTLTGQTFEDLPLSNPFYLWVENLAQNGVMSGYECGGEGEPCVPPISRPYFRSGNNTTRGQIAKVVSNTFFPNCIFP